jgi:SAM-dependent methyltransferase
LERSAPYARFIVLHSDGMSENMPEPRIGRAALCDPRSRSAFWLAYYTDLAVECGPALDLSNARVHAQSIALCLEAGGELDGRVCLDLGCGRGRLAAAAHALGAAAVTAVDQVPALVAENRAARPDLDWKVGDVTDRAFLAGLPRFDRVFLAEILQYVDATELVPLLWEHVGPGGRLVGMVPNADCPIVARTTERFGGHYQAIGAGDLAAIAARLRGLAGWGLRGLRFAGDQRIAPYAVDGWRAGPPDGAPPNRLNFVLLKEEQVRS